MRKVILLLPLLPFVVAACPSRDAIVDVRDDPAALASASASADSGAGASGLTAEEEAALDKSVSPCESFYAYACGGWIKGTPIPDDEDFWMRSFSTIREKNEALLRTILEAFALREDAREGGREVSVKESQALGDLYASCMDEKGIEERDLAPLAKYTAEIDAVKDAAGLAAVLGKMHARGMTPVFAVGQQQDYRDATKVIGRIEQAGLGMPEREYYSRTDDASVKLRAAYKEHVAKMLALLATPALANAKVDPKASDKAKAGADVVMKIEGLLADASMAKEDLRDPKKVFHAMSADDVAKEFPGFAWDAYKKELGAKQVATFNVAEPAFLHAAVDLVAGKITIAEWKTYLRFHLVRATAAALPSRFVSAAFEWQHTLRGTAKLAPRWKQCVRAADAEMGDALGHAFVVLSLGDEGKAKVKELVFEIEAAMSKDLDGLSWMSDGTRGRAREKLSSVKNKIGYPDAFRSYDGLTIERGHHFENMLAGESFEMKRELAKIGKPKDRAEWQMTPPRVDAYYDNSMNEMVFPAGILQPPFYAVSQPAALNFGGIGVAMGHELTHGFDDEGRQFDGDGNLRDFWTDADAREFEKRAACISMQYDAYRVPADPAAKVNGRLTLGENIADLGGVKLAYAAFRAHMEARPEPALGAVTEEQRFFLGFAQSWCGSYRPRAMSAMLATNAHAPPELRVNGPLSNMREFQKAFACPDGSKMARKDRCEIW